MTSTMTFRVHMVRRDRGRLELREGEAAPRPSLPAVVPSRIARLVAVAHRVEALVRCGKIVDYAQVALLAGITRARASQIVNLLFLAPEIQEQLLFMDKPATGREFISEQDLRHVAAEPDWASQRVLFEKLMARRAERRAETNP